MTYCLIGIALANATEIIVVVFIIIFHTQYHR